VSEGVERNHVQLPCIDAWQGHAAALVGQGGGSTLAWWPRPGARVGFGSISSTTWQATTKPGGYAMLGLMLAELDYGPIVKVFHLSMLYKFHLSTMVIRLTD
jgi:hypothetical protein